MGCPQVGSGQPRFGPNPHSTWLDQVTEKLTRTHPKYESDPPSRVIGWGGSDSTVWRVWPHWTKFVDFHGFKFFGPFWPIFLGFLNFVYQIGPLLHHFFQNGPVPFKIGLQGLLEHNQLKFIFPKANILTFGNQKKKKIQSKTWT